MPYYKVIYPISNKYLWNFKWKKCFLFFLFILIKSNQNTFGSNTSIFLSTTLIILSKFPACSREFSGLNRNIFWLSAIDSKRFLDSRNLESRKRSIRGTFYRQLHLIHIFKYKVILIILLSTRMTKDLNKIC